MATARFETGEELRVMIYQTDLRTKPVSPSQGYRLILANSDISVRDGFVDNPELDSGGVPSKEMDARLPVNGTIDQCLRFDDVPHMLQHCVGPAVTTGVGPDYVHTQTLGGALWEGFAFEEHKLQAATLKYVLAWGGRISTLDMTKEVEGAVMLRYGAEFLVEELPSATVTADTITEPTDFPVDQQLGTLSVDGGPTDSGDVVSWAMTLDHQLQADDYPACNQGKRSTLSRTIPKLTGNFEVYANDNALDLVATKARVRPRIPISFTWRIQESATRYMEVRIINALLAVTGDPQNGPGGYNYTFDWSASGPGCLVIETGNQTASYPAIP